MALPFFHLSSLLLRKALRDEGRSAFSLLKVFEFLKWLPSLFFVKHFDSVIFHWLKFHLLVLEVLPFPDPRPLLPSRWCYFRSTPRLPPVGDVPVYVLLAAHPFAEAQHPFSCGILTNSPSPTADCFFKLSLSVLVP